MADEKSGWMQTERPFWWPDSRGFLLASMVIICGVSMFYRMTHPSEVNDKILDMMITIAFSTCLVLVYNWSFGSSSDTGKQQDTQNKIVEKLTSAPPGGPVAPVPSPTTAADTAWWNKMTDAERAAINAAGAADPSDTKLAAILSGPVKMKPDQAEIDHLVSLGLLTPGRATAIQGA